MKNILTVGKVNKCVQQVNKISGLLWSFQFYCTLSVVKAIRKLCKEKFASKLKDMDFVRPWKRNRLFFFLLLIWPDHNLRDLKITFSDELSNDYTKCYHTHLSHMPIRLIAFHRNVKPTNYGHCCIQSFSFIFFLLSIFTENAMRLKPKTNLLVVMWKMMSIQVMHLVIMIVLWSQRSVVIEIDSWQPAREKLFFSFSVNMISFKHDSFLYWATFISMKFYKIWRRDQ